MSTGASDWVERKAAELGPAGRMWLAGLADVVAELQRRWAFTVEHELEGGTGSWVARVRLADGAPAVVKIALPDDASAREAAVLRAAEGRGYARLLADAPEHRALLLEALGPALDRAGFAPEEQLTVLCDVLRDAWSVPIPVDAVPASLAADLAAEVARRWDALGRPCSARVRDLALECARRRAGGTGRLVVVHGDPHPGNALRRPDGAFVFVDPVGLVADPAYDLGVVLRDWCAELLAGDAVALAGRYARILADATGTEAAAVAEWGFLERVSTGLYVLELGRADVAEPFLRTAELLASGRHVDDASGRAGSA